MACGTQQRRAVIERLVRQARVAVVRGSPRIRAMAQTAVLRGIEVTRVLAGRYCAVVAGGTGSKHLIMVHGGHWFPDGRVVAVLADVGRLHMQRALAGSFGAVVAAEAVVHDVDVVEVRRYPGDGGVTIIAIVTAGDVGRVFASRSNAVMAGAAGTNDLGVVNGKHGHPHIAAVAVFANVAGLNVRGVFAGCVGAVMAAEAVARNVHVIEICW